MYDTAIYETIDPDPLYITPLSHTGTVVQEKYEDDHDYEHIIDNVKINRNPCYAVPEFKTAY